MSETAERGRFRVRGGELFMDEVRTLDMKCVLHSSVKLSLEIFFAATNFWRVALGTFAQNRV